MTLVSGECIYLSTETPGSNWNALLDWGNTGPDGSFTIWGIPAGNWYVKARNNCGGDNLPYIEEWYAVGGSTPDGDQADAITIVASQMLSGIDFQLDHAKTISGRVIDEQTQLPISGAAVYVTSTTQQFSQYEYCTDEDGYYSFTAPLGSASYKVGASGSSNCGSNPNYQREYWNGTYLWKDATPISVDDATPLVENINFSLQLSGTSVQGYIRDKDTNQPIAQACVFAGDDAGVTTGFIASNNTGWYEIPGLSTSSYIIEANGFCGANQFYSRQYWDQKPTFELC